MCGRRQDAVPCCEWCSGHPCIVFVLPDECQTCLKHAGCSPHPSIDSFVEFAQRCVSRGRLFNVDSAWGNALFGRVGPCPQPLVPLGKTDLAAVHLNLFILLMDGFGAIRSEVLISTSTLAWGVNFPAHLAGLGAGGFGCRVDCLTGLL